jgi:hypothetical protein
VLGLGRRGRGRRGQRLGALPVFVLLVLSLTRFFSKFCIEVDQVMNTKVVDLATLDNFYKGYIGVFFTDFELQECQL